LKKTIVLGQYQGYLSDLRKTLFVRFGVNAKFAQLIKHLNGDVVIKEVEMTDDQERRIKAWRDETIVKQESEDAMPDVQM
jgi:hypothetical protein